MEVLFTEMLKNPVDVPIWAGAKTMPNFKLWPAGIVAGRSGKPVNTKPVPDMATLVRVPVPVPWLRMVMVAVVLAFTSMDGKAIAAPDRRGRELPSAKAYEAVRLDALVDAVSVP